MSDVDLPATYGDTSRCLYIGPSRSVKRMILHLFSVPCPILQLRTTVYYASQSTSTVLDVRRDAPCALARLMDPPQELPESSHSFRRAAIPSRQPKHRHTVRMVGSPLVYLKYSFVRRGIFVAAQTPACIP